MFIGFSKADLDAAPQDVKDWVNANLFGIQKSPSSVAKIEAETKAITKEIETTGPTKVDIPSHQDVVNKAAELLAKDKSKLKEVLDSLGLKRISECPENRRADLLAAIAVHV